MVINKELLEHELEGLRLQLQDVKAQVNLVLGAIQMAEQLIAMADKPDEPPVT
jgi:hypothetical protein